MPNITTIDRMQDLSQEILQPPIRPPSVLYQTRTRVEVKDRKTGEPKMVLKCPRKLVKGKIRSSGFPYVSPSRTHGKRDRWRVRYSRRGYVFDRTFKSRLLCAWVANEIRNAEDPELMKKLGRQLVDPLNFIANAADPQYGGFIWVHDIDQPSLIKIDYERFGEVGNRPWFWMKGRSSPVTPVITIKRKKVILSWRDLWMDLWDRPMERCKSIKQYPKKNPAGQWVSDWTSSNISYNYKNI